MIYLVPLTTQNDVFVCICKLTHCSQRRVEALRKYIAGNCIFLLGISRDSQWLQYITEKTMGIAGAH